MQLKSHLLLVIFFVFITLSLFLGDGLQPLIVAVGALCIIIMYVIARFKQLPTHPSSPTLQVAWLSLISFLILRTLFSDSIGLSVTALIRVISAYLVFYFFTVFGKRAWAIVFVQWLLRISVFAIFISFVLLLIPRWGYLLPPMNLVFAAFGHNQIVSLLFLTMPLVVQRFLDSPSLKNSCLFVFYVAGFVLSFSRGSIIILIFLFLYLLAKNRARSRKIQSVFLVALSITFILLLSAQIIMSQNSAENKFAFIPYFLRRQLVKPFTLETTRLNYWQQAWQAFKDKPLIGHGPGTFYLLSKRYQEAPNQYSYYAHSLPLETLAESGIIGFGLLGSLLVVVFRKSQSNSSAIKQYNNLIVQQSSLLKQGLILTLIYSCFEFNLNFITIWLLFWAGWGILIKEQVTSKIQKSYALITKIGLTLLTIYYAITIISLLVNKLPTLNQPRLIFYLIPFDRFHAIKFMQSSKRLETQELHLMNFFHSSDSEVFRALLKNTELVKDNFDYIEKLFTRIVTTDPKNTQNFSLFFTLYKDQPAEKWEESYIFLIKHSLPDAYKSIFASVEPLLKNKFSGIVYDTFSSQSSFGNRTSEEYFANLSYKLGLVTVQKEPNVTRALWQAASQLDPSISYYAVELASLHFTVLNDYEAAYSALTKCQKNKGAAQHCFEIESAYKVGNYDIIPPLGYFKILL